MFNFFRFVSQLLRVSNRISLPKCVRNDTFVLRQPGTLENVSAIKKNEKVSAEELLKDYEEVSKHVHMYRNIDNTYLLFFR